MSAILSLGLVQAQKPEVLSQNPEILPYVAMGQVVRKGQKMHDSPAALSAHLISLHLLFYSLVMSDGPSPQWVKGHGISLGTPASRFHEMVWYLSVECTVTCIYCSEPHF